MNGSTRFGLIGVAAALAGTAGMYCMGTRASGQVAPVITKKASMKREIIRVEPLSTYLEKWKAPTSAVTRNADTIYVSGFPPFDPDTGEVVNAPIERQTELVLEQMKLCLETAGSLKKNQFHYQRRGDIIFAQGKKKRHAISFLTTSSCSVNNCNSSLCHSFSWFKYPGTYLRIG